MPRVLKLTMTNFKKEIEKKTEGEFKNLNLFARPRLKVVTVSLRVGRFKDDPKAVAKALEELAVITGQLPSGRLSKKAISSFKLKEGELVGFLVSLRGDRMRDFVEKLVKVVMPSVRDFRGLPARSVDKQGNLNIGLKDQTVFPEIDPNKIDRLRGLGISLVGQGLKDRPQARKFWETLGFIFSRESLVK